MMYCDVDSTRTYRKARGGVHGFTLIELLVVIAIMATLATVAMPLMKLSEQRTKEAELRYALKNIREAIDRYKRMADEGRIERAAEASGYPPTLQVLVEGVPDIKSPQGTKLYFLRSLPRDPFASAAIASALDTWAPRSYASPPGDPQPGADVYDIHSRSERPGLNGVVYRLW